MSGFIEDTYTRGLGIDWIKPVAVEGTTSQCYIVEISGKSFFMKRLRKEYASNKAYRLLYCKEFEKGISISHPNIVKYESLHDTNEDCYILMENIIGETLDAFIKSHPRYFGTKINLDKFFRQLLSALKCLHENHVVYSDLKPQNIMLSQVNNDVKIIDLGFCFTDSHPNSAGTTKGYSAPEHRNQGKLDVSTDVYGVGKIIEYIGENSAKKLPKVYRKVMAKCLQEQQADRYQNIDEILAELNKSEKIWHRWPKTTLCVLFAIVAAVGYLIWDKQSNVIDISSGIVSENHIQYSNFDSEKLTCEAIGPDSLSLHIPSLYIRELVEYQGKEYIVTSIANSAFKSLLHLNAIYIPEGVVRIGSNAFYGCDSLRVINIPNSVTELGEDAFYSCRGVKELILSKNLKEIPTACFVATDISRLDLPEGLETIRLDAFAHCAYLKEVKIPSTVKHLGRGVFYNCDKLEKIELPAGLERTDEYLFYGCEKLKDIYIHAVVPPRALALHRKPSQITLHVPAEAIEAYKNARYWQDMNIVALQ